MQEDTQLLTTGFDTLCCCWYYLPWINCNYRYTLSLLLLFGLVSLGWYYL